MCEQTDGLEILRRTIHGYIKHPNFCHILVVGLGCESNQIGQLIEELHKHQDQSKDHKKELHKKIHTLIIQEEGGTKKTINKGIELIDSLLDEANSYTREDVPVSELKLALQCGGSDGFSGLTANPALG